MIAVEFHPDAPRPSCVMQCGRPACGFRVDGRDLCAHCFITVVEIVAHEVGHLYRPPALRVVD